jgi:hypothetical protein
VLVHSHRLTVRALSAGLAATLGAAVLASGCAGASNGATGNRATDAGSNAGTGPAGPSCVPSTLNVSAALAGSRVTVSPGPGVRDASATSQLSFLFAAGASGGTAGNADLKLSHLLVSGSRSGAHPGRLLAYSQGDGASFVPTKPFAPGELVTVHAQLREGTTTVPFAWSFTVAVPDRPGSASVTESTRTSPAPAPAPKEYQSFRSRPELRPPDVTVSAMAPTATGGDLFLSRYARRGLSRAAVRRQAGAHVVAGSADCERKQVRG